MMIRSYPNCSVDHSVTFSVRINKVEQKYRISPALISSRHYIIFGYDTQQLLPPIFPGAFDCGCRGKQPVTVAHLLVYARNCHGTWSPRAAGPTAADIENAITILPTVSSPLSSYPAVLCLCRFGISDVSCCLIRIY